MRASLRHHLPYLAWGLLFGWLLSRAGATSFRLIHEMFLLQNFHLYGVIGAAIAVALPGMALLQRLQRKGKIPPDVPFPKRQFRLGTWAGAPIFGVGWALTGTCPGTAVSQVGEGHFFALATVAGILLGQWLFYKIRPHVFGNVETCG
jgi:uncharacterized membrane protein YedE/YeeE